MEGLGVRSAVARVLGSAGEPVGAAFLVTPNLLLTAAHVVGLAAGNGQSATERPSGRVVVSFVVAPNETRYAEVVHWLPPGDMTPEDIAGLRLVDPVPDGVTPAQLDRPPRAVRPSSGDPRLSTRRPAWRLGTRPISRC